MRLGMRDMMDDIARQAPVVVDDGHDEIASCWPVPVLSVLAWALIAWIGRCVGWW